MKDWSLHITTVGGTEVRIHFTFVLLLLWIGGQQYSYGQLHTARIQATGLTCALCSKAIYKSLEKLSPIEKVTADIKSSTFSIQFKKDAAVNPDELKAAVEDAE